MIITLLSLGWFVNFHKLKKSAKKRSNYCGRIAYKLFCLKHQCYISKDSSIANDVWFPHMTGIHIANDVVIGKGSTIYQNVTLGSNRLKGTKHPGAPKIGNNVLIGANACIIGGVKIGNNVKIGAGCVIVEDVPSDSVVVMSKPRILNANVKN